MYYGNKVLQIILNLLYTQNLLGNPFSLSKPFFFNFNKTAIRIHAHRVFVIFSK